MQKSGEHELRLVVYPVYLIIYKVLTHPSSGFLAGCLNRIKTTYITTKSRPISEVPSVRKDALPSEVEAQLKKKVRWLNTHDGSMGLVHLRPGSFVCRGSEIGWVTGVD